LVICEEVAYQDPKMMTQVILPTLITGLACLMITSVAKEEGNFINQFMSKTSSITGKPLFNIVYQQSECEDCRAAFRRCYHNRMVPSWHSTSRMLDLEDKSPLPPVLHSSR
jgi:hypothetical protein